MNETEIQAQAIEAIDNLKNTDYVVVTFINNKNQKCHTQGWAKKIQRTYGNWINDIVSDFKLNIIE